MFKIKKVFVSIICALLLVTSFSTVISVSAKDMTVTHSNSDVENINMYVQPDGCRVGLNCMTHWAAVTTTDKTYYNSLKYVCETSYCYQNRKYNQQSQKFNTSTELTVSTPDSVIVNGYTQKVAFYGDLYPNTDIASDIMDSLRVYFYRPGAPVA